MGKLSLKKKTTPEDGNNQKKISSFFQTGNAVQKKEEKSALFQSIGGQKQPEAKKQDTKNKADHNSISVASYIEAKKTKTKSSIASSIDDHRANDPNAQEATNQHELDRICIPETQFEKTPERFNAAKNKSGSCQKSFHNKSLNVDSDICDDSDCDIIPATPGASSSTELTNRKRPFGRSFLSGTLSNKPPCQVSAAANSNIVNKNLKQKPNKLKKTATIIKTNIPREEKWNSNDETMRRVLTDIGVPDKAKASLGLQDAGVNVVNDPNERKCLKNSSDIVEKQQNLTPESIKPGEKRQHPSGEKELPPCKKRITVNDSNDVTNNQALGLGTRGGLILEKSMNATARKDSESDSSVSDIEEDVMSNALKLFSKEPYEDGDLNVKKFSWKSKQNQPPAERSIKHKKNDTKFGKKKDVKIGTTGHENALSDLLGEMKENKTDKVSTDGINIPFVKLKKKRSSMGNAISSNEVVKSPSESDNVDCKLVDHTEADDVLTDIMSELKQTLTQQNKLSVEKSSSKKRQVQHKVHYSNLDNSISRQLDFKEAFDTELVSGPKHLNVKNKNQKNVHNIDHNIDETNKAVNTHIKKETSENELKPLPDIPEQESSESQSTVVDEQVAGSKVCGSLFQEESWLEDMDMEEFDASVLSSPFKQNLNESRDTLKYDPTKTRPPAEAFGRHVVKQVQHHGPDIVLTVQPVNKGQDRTVILQGFWTDTNIDCGDIVHVIGDFNEDGSCYITDLENFIVVNPDMLISGTTVVSTVYCMRKSVLNEKFKGTDGRNIHMLHGSIIHAFFQEVLLQCHEGRANRHMKEIAKDILRQPGFLHEMYAIGATQDSVMEEMTKLFPLVTKFVQSYLSGKKSGNLSSKPTKDIEIIEIKDIEENIWSPRFGIKGKIDLTVEVKIHSDRSSATTTRMMPLELKTGKPSFSVEHKGQVTLYSMMSSDRREDPQGGLLLYLRDPQLKTIPAHYSHKRGLIQLRNELAHYLKSSTQRSGDHQFGRLPAPINNERSCSKCPHLLNCTAYLSVVEKSDVADSHAMKTLVPQSIGHLTSEHLEYFRLWCEMMHLEISASRSIGVSQIWCETAWKREDNGEAFCSMVLYHADCKPTDGEKFIQAFKRHPHSTVETTLSTVGLIRGESVVVSAENQPLISLCMGNIHSITDEMVMLLVDRDLRKNPEYKDLVYRIDKCDTYNSMATNFTSVSKLLQNSEVGEKLRELVIERRPPQFEVTMSKTNIEKVMPIMKQLNKPQKTAILKVLMCKDYVLIKGYPGTGKTSTIVALVRILSAIGFSVLLTSYTHSAVDNILLKLKKHDVKFLRMGRVERIHPDIQKYSAETLSKSCETVQQLEEFYNSYPVIATTCLGTNHVLFSRRRFDLCIVDEASQVLQPACLGPLFCSNKFVLVGDPLQLPPVVQSHEAKELGMSKSLFVRLDETGGTYELNMQYRMNSEIVRLSNELVYSGALKCGSQSVADGRHKCSNSLPEELPSWVYRATGTDTDDHVLFLNTEKVTHGSKDTGGVKNKLEAVIIKYLAQQFVNVGVSQTEVGVISPYRQQVRLLHDLLTTDLGQVEVNTVDQYQGRDKEVILLSLVKHGLSQPRPGEILQDLRRLNVALTRAKYKLLMIGHMTCLGQYGPIKDILSVLRPQQIIELPQNTLQHMT